MLQGRDSRYSVKIIEYPKKENEIALAAIKVATYFTLLVPVILLTLKSWLKSLL